MGLTNHTQPISHHITPLVINTLGGGHIETKTQTQKQIHTTISRKPGVHGQNPCTPGLKSFELKLLQQSKSLTFV